MTTTFIVERRELRHGSWVHSGSAPLPPGGVRLRIDSFALTSNNITYAAFGDAMNYWSFFPTGEATSGCIPVWGFGKVVESRCADVLLDDRCYGYFPMADETVLLPVRTNRAGFVDGAAHRKDLPAVYNHYLRCSTDPLYDAAREAEQALLRPLFTTAFLIDDFLADNAFFGARRVLLSSASSKTAYGTAFCLSQRRGGPQAVQTVGLTSAANAPFARRLGCYDDVLTYDDVNGLSADVPTVYVDMSGSVSTRASIHRHLGDALKYSCSVGGTHWDELGRGRGLVGPRPVLFFAPAQIRKRHDDWGAEALGGRIAQAWHAFMRPVTEGEWPWLQVVRENGTTAVETVYAALLEGRVPAREGHILNV